MTNSQPELNGNPFARRNDEQKIGVEGGYSCHKKIINSYSAKSKAAQIKTQG
ncbi:hypothetical protein [Chryseobacterium indoltheticum]|uniref:hypothetical protein n=1 Tax=Chryseobacterium indoltheticum TaxID=254 RepID=UPI003F49AC18